MTERQSARMSKIKNGGLDQYGTEPFEQWKFGTVGVEGVNALNVIIYSSLECYAVHQVILFFFFILASCS